MNWFERYGIPGTYFVGLMAGWIYAIYPQIIQIVPPHKLDDLLAPTVISLIAISLPIGYAISIIGMSVYLNWRQCFWNCKCLRSWLGFHGAALDRLDPKNTRRDEAVIEALSTHYASLPENRLPIENLKYTRHWIRRRMDVVAINLSLIVATVLAWFVAFVIFRPPPLSWFQWPPSSNATLLIINLLVIAAMIWNITTLRRQVVEIIRRQFDVQGFIGEVSESSL